MSTKIVKKPVEQADISKDYEPDVRVVDINLIDVNDWNPNAMDMETFNILTETVRKEGMNQPILVREKAGKKGEEIRYDLVDGEHRFKASKAAGLKKIMVVVVPYTDDMAKIRTISMNQIKGEYIPLKMAKLLAELQETYSEEEIRRMTGVREEEFSNLMNLLDVPEPVFEGSVEISSMEVVRPIPVNLLLMPDEHGSYEEAMNLAIIMGGDAVVPVVGEQVGAYDNAMRQAFGITGAKLRNLGLAVICEVFNALPKEQKEELVGKAKQRFKAFISSDDE